MLPVHINNLYLVIPKNDLKNNIKKIVIQKEILIFYIYIYIKKNKKILELQQPNIPTGSIEVKSDQH